MNEIDRIVDEIKQIKSQYAAEVGEGRRAWPKSIRNRIDQLEDLGLKPKVIAARTLVPYETVCYWRYNRSPAPKRRFHSLAVKNHEPSIKQSATENLIVTVAGAKKAEPVILTVTVTLPNGIRIESVPFAEVRNLLTSIGGL
jgi:hypothetical protein